MDIQNDTGYSFYDSLILAGADRAGCKIVFSEDLQAGRAVKNMEVVNPFARLR